MAAPEEFASVESTPAPDFYTWTFPGSPVRIHLHLSVVEHLNREVRRAFDSIPSHSVEIGGLLLGTADFQTSPIVEIKDFEPFLCEYRADHKFILSDFDRRKLERALAARRSGSEGQVTVVGYYRSHIGQSLGLSEQDLAIAQQYFFDPASVFLLIRPSTDGTSTAGFFFWDNGRIDAEFTYLEFPFEAQQLTGGRIKPTRQDSPSYDSADYPEAGDLPTAPASGSESWSAPAVATEEFEEQEFNSSGRKLRWLFYPLLVASLIAVGALGYPAYVNWMASRAPAPVVADPRPALNLQVERRGADLRVIWNRNLPAIRYARQAVLSIRDGDAQLQDVRIEPDQFRNGSVSYTPTNSSVQFRLEATGDDGQSISETVLALTSQQPAPTVEKAGSSTPPANPPENRPQVPTASHASEPPSRKSVSASVPSGTSGDTVRVVMVDPVPPGASAAPQSPPNASPQPASHPEAYVAARPIREPQPKLPPDVRGTVKSEVEVQVKVQIDETGRVLRADPVASVGPVNMVLVSAARNAARLWRFAPALRGTQPVPSEVILRFRYRPAKSAN